MCWYINTIQYCQCSNSKHKGQIFNNALKYLNCFYFFKFLFLYETVIHSVSPLFPLSLLFIHLWNKHFSYFVLFPFYFIFTIFLPVAFPTFWNLLIVLLWSNETAFSVHCFPGILVDKSRFRFDFFFFWQDYFIAYLYAVWSFQPEMHIFHQAMHIICLPSFYDISSYFWLMHSYALMHSIIEDSKKNSNPDVHSSCITWKISIKRNCPSFPAWLPSSTYNP